VRHSSPACPTLTPGCQRPSAVITGFSHDLLLLCAAGDRELVQGLATKLGDAGPKAKVQTVAPHALAADLTAALEQAPLVLLAVSAALQSPVAEVLAGAVEALPPARLLLLQLDEEALEGLPAAVEVIAWPRQGRGRGKLQRQQALVRIQELAGPISTPLQSAAATPDPAQAEAADPANESSSRRDNFNKEVRNALKDRVGGFCSRPGCKSHTTGPHDNPDKVTDTGVAAHITAAAPGGPRYKAELTTAQRKAADNGMWLCQFCAKLIDSDPATYPEALLREWKAWAEQEQQDRQLGVTRGRSDWSWPGGSWDFGPYRKERRQGFVGRDWLLRKVRAWAGDPEAKQALLIGADFGVGKSAFLAKLLDREDAILNKNDLDGEPESQPRTGIGPDDDRGHQHEDEAGHDDRTENPSNGLRDAGPGLPVVAQHFCNSEENSYLSPGRFVQSLAAQLKEELPAYRKALENDEATSLRESLNRAEAEPLLAFQQALVAPLAKIPAPATRRLLVIDALDEALDYRPEAGGSGCYTIVDLLAKEARNLPPWLRVLATSRRRDEVLEPLRQGFFSIEEINAEEAENLADIHAYVEVRCQQEPLAAILCRAGLSASETAEVLQDKSGGKFLYAVRVLNDIASDALQLENRQGLDALPPGMDGFYADTFERRFPEEASYAAVKPLLALLCAQLEPMGYGQLAAILEVSIDQIGLWIEPLQDLLRFRATPPSELASESEEEWRISFDHASLEQWLTERSGGRIPRRRAGRFGVDREVAAEQIRTWALAEVEANRAHTTPYLVRHLASHLRDEERAEVIAGQLRQFPWLQARLRLAGLNALLGDFDSPSDGQASLPPELQRLGRALRQAAHVIGHQEGWNGEEQLASQLLARLEDDGPLVDLQEQTAEWLQKTGGAPPRAASLLAQEALLRTLPVGSQVTALVALHDGRLACGCSDGSIRLWDPASGSCSAVFEGHQDWVYALAVLGDGRLASGSRDQTIRLWDPASGSCSAVFEGHRRGVSALAVLGDGRLASGSLDKTIRLWDPASGSCNAVFQGHRRSVSALAVLGDGRLASASEDATIRLWDPASGSCNAVFQGHWLRVNALAVLGDGRLASGSDDRTISIWDPASGSCSAIFEGHQDGVRALAVLGDGRLASASEDATIRLWDPASGSCSAISQGHQDSVRALAVLGDGRLASGSLDNTIRLWDPASGSCSAVFQGHQREVNALAVLGDGRLASGGGDATIRLWDPASGSCSAVFQGHQGGVSALAVLGDGRLASGGGDEGDETIRLWDPASGSCSAIAQGHQSWVNALAVLGDGRLASGSLDKTIRLWDPASGSCSAVFEGHQSRVNALAVLGDGRLASGSDDNTIRLWDPASGSCSAVFQGHQREVIALAVLGDGRLASGSDDNTIRLWDPASGSCSAISQGHQDGVLALAVLGDGRLASGSYDNTIRLWDPRRPDGAPRVLFVADAAITALAWVPTHQLLVAGDASGRLHWLAMGGLQR
jgi:WD40 repeat protein